MRKVFSVRGVVAALLALTALAAATPRAAAEQQIIGGNRYALVTLYNNTSRTIYYSYRWGSKSWRTNSIAPGKSYWHSWTYAWVGENRSPDFRVEFRTGGGRRAYLLPRNPAPFQLPIYGRPYHFVEDGSGIELRNGKGR
jgi:hypothetical protein